MSSRTRTTALAALVLALLAGTGGAGAAPAKPAARKAATPAPAKPRRLEDVRIEGEIPVPQVLFITAQEQQRFTEFQHRRHLPTSLKVGEETMHPAWIAWIGGRPAEVRKETPR